MILGQSKHLARLIDDLLDVSRISRGKIRLRKEPLDPASVLRRAVEVVTPFVQERGHLLDFVFEPDLPTIEADATRVEQIVVNLLTNAAKYTERGGSIALHASGEDGWLVVSVKDNGIGIPKDMLATIFEPFEQVGRSLDRSEGGLGIGLTLVKELVEIHGGKVKARSLGLGKGSEFIVRLPARFAEPMAPTSQAPSPLACLKPFKILVVDDNVDNANAFSSLLELLGHNVRVSHDGRSGLELRSNKNPTYSFSTSVCPF